VGQGVRARCHDLVIEVVSRDPGGHAPEEARGEDAPAVPIVAVALDLGSVPGDREESVEEVVGVDVFDGHSRESFTLDFDSRRLIPGKLHSMNRLPGHRCGRINYLSEFVINQSSRQHSVCNRRR